MKYLISDGVFTQGFYEEAPSQVMILEGNAEDLRLAREKIAKIHGIPLGSVIVHQLPDEAVVAQ